MTTFFPKDTKVANRRDDTLPSLILRLADSRRGRTALRRKDGGKYQNISWEEMAGNIRSFGRGLLAMGLGRGDRVAIMAPNSPEWVYADLGIMACGARSVPVYHTEGTGSVLHLLNDSGAAFLFIHSSLAAREILGRLDEIPLLQRVILLEGIVDHPRILHLDDFLRAADTVDEIVLEQRLSEGAGDEVATFVYTSGTTGLPKGAMLTHRNFLSNIEACVRLFDIGPQDECLSFLPLSHVFERMAGYYLMLRQGAVIAYAENVDSVPANLLEIRPTILISVPRLYEKMYARVMERVLSGPVLQKQLFFGGLNLCRILVGKERRGENPGVVLKRLVELARRVVFSRIRMSLGGRLRFFVSGGAALGPEIAEFFLAVGLPIYEGYGLTETSPVIAVNTRTSIKPGTVGPPLPGTEVRIAEDGEILVKGPGVFLGYWNRPKETAQAFTDGWFRTGDIGRLDEEGRLQITDRKKDLIVTAGGENIAPQLLEARLKTDKFIANALVFGDGKPFLTALLVPNFDNLEKFARQDGIDFLNHCDLVNHPKALSMIRRRIDELQAGDPSFQRIKRFTLLSRDFTGTEITPTMKIRRKEVKEHFHRMLDGMYLPTDHGSHDSGFCIVEEFPVKERT